MINGLGIFAYKCGMTRFFTEDGLSIPVTVVKIYKNYLIDIKKINDTHCLIKVAACAIKRKHITKSLAGLYKKLCIENLKYINEFCVESKHLKNYNIGNELQINIFEKTEKLNVIGITKGKGFAGVIKRHNFKSQKASHGNSLSHRAPGSIGQCQDPGKVFKGKKMAGRLGNDKITIKNIEIINIYSDINVILLKGALPGAKGNKIILKKNIN